MNTPVIVCQYFWGIFLLCSACYAQNCPTNIAYGKNIVCNGDFEAGTYCFYTDYTPFAQSPFNYSTPDYYYLGGNANFFNMAFSGSNHTPGGNKFLMVDGSCVPNRIVWRQTVNILPNTNYFFSAWICSLLSSFPAQLQFSINGVVVGSPFNAPGTTNLWIQVTQLWNSGSLNGPVVISIIDLTTAGCSNGNDFGVDDISFVPGCAFGAPGPQPDLGPDVYLCAGQSVVLNSGLNAPYTNLNIHWSTGATTPAITVTTPGVYSVCVDSAGSCTRSDVIQVISGDSIKANFVAFPLSGCSPLVVWAKNSTKGAPLTFQWYVDGILTSYTTDSLPRQTFTATGSSPVTHTIKMTAKNKCGKSADTTIAVTVYPPPQINATADTSVCNGTPVQLNAFGGGTYTWKPSTGLSCTTCANPVANPGYGITYTVTVVNGNGCSDTDQVKLTILYNLNIKMNDTAICTGASVILNTGVNSGSSYNWSPATGLSCTTCANPSASPTTTTTYNVNVSKGNCSGNGSVTVHVKSCAPGVTANNITACSGTCGTIAAAANGGQAPYSYQWNTGATTSSIFVCPSATSIYSVIITDANNATATTSATVTINSAPSATVTPSATICSGDSYTLSAGGGSSYLWSTGSTSSLLIISPSATTNYSVVVGNASGCTSLAATAITVSSSPSVSISGNTVLCRGDIATLSASGGVNYSWSNGSTASSISLSPSGTTTYSVTSANASGCASTASIVVTVLPPPLAAISGNNTICAGKNTTLTANGGSGGGNYLWSNGQTIASIMVSPATTANYSVIVSAGSCADTAYYTVTVNPNPVANISGVSQLCQGTSATLTATGGGTYLWNTGSSSSSVVISPFSTGHTAYTVTVANGSGCTAVATVTISVYPQPVASIAGNTSICEGMGTVLTAGGGGNYLWSTSDSTSSISVSPTVTSGYSVLVSIGTCTAAASYTVTVMPVPAATAQSNVTINIGESATLLATGGGSYSWVPFMGLSCADCPNPAATPGRTTDYCVYVKNAACFDTACVTVTVDYNCKPVYVPNAFSPNSDGENDVLYVYGNCIKEMKMVIYNRWGEKVYEGADPKEGWDGFFRGEMENPAVFAYYLTYKLFTGSEGKKSGNISLLR